jgi:hypothetical protein
LPLLRSTLETTAAASDCRGSGNQDHLAARPHLSSRPIRS